MPIDLKFIAGNIRRRRENLGYSQYYMGVKMGTGQNAFSKLELGLTRITVERLFQIAELLHTDAATLIRPDAFEEISAA